MLNFIRESQINEGISGKVDRVIDGDGTHVGILPIEEALLLSIDRKLALVKVAPQAKPPVCKIMDYGKYRYELQKKEKEARKKQKQNIVELKEIRLSTFIEEHDLMVKANNAVKFLKEGDKVKVSLRFRGRERDHVDAGQRGMQSFTEAISDAGNVDRAPLLEGRSLIMILAPKVK